MKNLGKFDKIIRLIVGIGLLSLLFVMNGNIKFLGFVGLIPIISAVVGVCPLYSIFGIKTCKVCK